MTRARTTAACLASVEAERAQFRTEGRAMVAHAFARVAAGDLPASYGIMDHNREAIAEINANFHRPHPDPFRLEPISARAVDPTTSRIFQLVTKPGALTAAEQAEVDAAEARGW